MANTAGSKFFFLILCATVLVLTSAKKSIQKITVRIKITESHSWCGGMQLTPEEMREIAKPVLCPRKKIFIRAGEFNLVTDPVLANGISDSLGIVSLSLKPGKYCLVDERKSSDKYIKQIFKKLKYGDKYNSSVTMECLLSWLKAPDLVFTVKKSGEQNFDLNYNVPCSWNATPCSVYHGPLPP
ncbi:MAG: hypothetical protein ACJ76F_09550 [Bacteroidia bacterium]